MFQADDPKACLAALVFFDNGVKPADWQTAWREVAEFECECEADDAASRVASCGIHLRMAQLSGLKRFNKTKISKIYADEENDG